MSTTWKINQLRGIMIEMNVAVRLRMMLLAPRRWWRRRPPQPPPRPSLPAAGWERRCLVTFGICKRDPRWSQWREREESPSLGYLLGERAGRVLSTLSYGLSSPHLSWAGLGRGCHECILVVSLTEQKGYIMRCKWSSLNATGTENPLCYPLLGLDDFPFSHYWPSGVIRIGLPVWKWKSLKNFGTKGAQPAANDLVWTPQELRAWYKKPDKV